MAARDVASTASIPHDDPALARREYHDLDLRQLTLAHCEENRLRHLARRTERTYVYWIRRFILYHGLRHPSRMGAQEVTAYLSHLATDRRVSASTQNQALAALLFLYRHTLDIDLPWLDDLVRAPRRARLPVVLTRREVRSVLARMHGVLRLMAILVYGSGLRLLEGCRLRVKDVDFARHQVHIRDPKGGRERLALLPELVHVDLPTHLVWGQCRVEKRTSRR